MAVIGNKKSKVSDEIPSSSMADIAFLLLIFFLVTTTFPKDKGLAIVLPESGETVEVSQKNILHIIVSTTGSVTIRRGEEPAGTERSSRRCRGDLAAGTWRRMRTSSPRSRPIPDAPYRFMVDVLDALQSAGAERISLQILE